MCSLQRGASFTNMNRYPQRTEATIVLICSLRGFIAFGISYGTVNFVEKFGYAGAFNICAGIVAALMVLGVFVYIFGKHIRKATQRFASDA